MHSYIWAVNTARKRAHGPYLRVVRIGLYCRFVDILLPYFHVRYRQRDCRTHNGCLQQLPATVAAGTTATHTRSTCTRYSMQCCHADSDVNTSTTLWTVLTPLILSSTLPPPLTSPSPDRESGERSKLNYPAVKRFWRTVDLKTVIATHLFGAHVRAVFLPLSPAITLSLSLLFSFGLLPVFHLFFLSYFVLQINLIWFDKRTKQEKRQRS